MTSRFTLLAVVLALGACGEREAPVAPAAVHVAAKPVHVSADIAAFYRGRGNRPLWVTKSGPRPEALKVAEAVAAAADDGLDPETYGSAELEAALAAAASGDSVALARAELLTSRAYAAFVHDLHVPKRAPAVTWIDEELEPRSPPARALLDSAAAGPGAVDSALAMNPLYEALSRGYARRRAAAPALTAWEEAVIRANLDRARVIPARTGRYVIVDAGSARLWMIDGRRVEGPMRVIVGKPGMQTPALAGFIRYTVLNPWWNVPPDLARQRAKKVLKSGPALLQRERLEILSDWSERARVIPASQVNWRSVAQGKTSLRLRQRPGGANVMGAMKFMLPNRLGIYLHDFPDKSLFERSDRRLSSGCVRLADARRLARFLYGGRVPVPAGEAPEQRVDLPEPVPVYITYLTALPDPSRGLVLQRDVYARDSRPAGHRA
jgi:murein L,D-transpeptidase YcbB/YkuD